MGGHGKAGGVGHSTFFTLVFAYGLIFWACYLGYTLYLGVTGNDFGVFHRAAGEPLDRVYALRERNPFVYPPPTVLWLQPLAYLNHQVGFAVWTALSIGLVAWMSARLADLRVALLVVASPALATTVATGQFGALVGAMILYAASLKGWRQGVLLGLAATIKPQMLIAAPLILLVRRDWGALVGACVAGATVILAQLVFLGADLWFEWMAAMEAFPKAVERAGAYAGSVSPAGVASRFHLPPLPFLISGIVLGVMLVWKRARLADRLELAALVIMASALFSPYLLVYDLVAMMPFVVQRMLARCKQNQVPALANFLAPFAGLSLLWLTISLTMPRRLLKATKGKARGLV